MAGQVAAPGANRRAVFSKQCIFKTHLHVCFSAHSSETEVPLAPPTGSGTHPVAAMQPLLHDADELLVAELVVAVLVEDLEDRVDQVVGQLDACGHVDGAGELL